MAQSPSRCGAASHQQAQQANPSPASKPSGPADGAPATEWMENEAVEPQRSSSDPYIGSQRRKRRKTRPQSSDIYATEYSGRLAWDLKDPEIASAKQAFYQKLAAVLILDSDGSSLGDCVVLQKTKEKRLMAMSPFWALVDRFPKHMQVPRVEGSFRAMVIAQFSDEQGYVGRHDVL